MIDEIKRVLEIAKQIYDQVQLARENHEYCRELNDRVQRISQSVQSLQDITDVKTHVASCLQPLLGTLQDCQRFIGKFSQPKHWNKRLKHWAWRTAKAKADDQKFQSLRNYLEAGMLLLQNALAVENKQDREVDRAQRDHQFEALRRRGSRMAHQLDELKALMVEAKGVTIEDAVSPTGETLYRQGQAAFQQKEYASAYDYFRQAADRDITDAHYALGELYLRGVELPGNPVEHDEVTAYQCLLLAAEDNHLKSLCLVAKLLAYGSDDGQVPADTELALELAEKARDQATTDKDQARAKRTYEQVARKQAEAQAGEGNVAAMSQLAHMLWQRQGVKPPDHPLAERQLNEQALEWAEKAKAAGEGGVDELITTLRSVL